MLQTSHFTSDQLLRRKSALFCIDLLSVEVLKERDPIGLAVFIAVEPPGYVNGLLQ